MSNPRNLHNVEKSTFFLKAGERAKNIRHQSNKVISVLQRAYRKAGRLDNNKSIVKEMLDEVKLLIRMLQAYYRREYTRLPAQTLIKALGAVIYFIWVIDLIPDFIIGLGYLDDASLIAWVITSLRKDIDAFEYWEYKQKI